MIQSSTKRGEEKEPELVAVDKFAPSGNDTLIHSHPCFSNRHTYRHVAADLTPGRATGHHELAARLRVIPAGA